MTRFRNLLDRIRDTRSGATTDPLGLDIPAENMPADIPVPDVTEEVRDFSTSEGPIRRQGADTTADPWLDAITPDPGEDTDPGGADLASPDPEPHHRAGAVRSVQTKYGPDLRRCPNIGCGAPCTGEACSVCTAAGRLPDHLDGYQPPGLERILPDPPPGYPRSSFLTEAILDGEEDDEPLALRMAHGLERNPTLGEVLPHLDECGPDATVAVLYPGGDAA